MSSRLDGEKQVSSSAERVDTQTERDVRGSRQMCGEEPPVLCAAHTVEAGTQRAALATTHQEPAL